MKKLFSLASVLAVLGLAVGAQAQSLQTSQRIVGNQISASMNIDMKNHLQTDTATLTFKDASGGPVYTIEFIARHPTQEPVVSPGVMDIVVTQHPVEDETPEMTLRVDGETVPLVARLHSTRSVVATVPLAEIDRIASAGVVVNKTFNTELQLGTGQTNMLKMYADRWLGRAR